MSQTESQKEPESVQVTQTETAEKKDTPASQPTPASLYVGELDPSVTEAMLFEIFNAIGPVSSIRVCRDAVTRQSLGYAYVNYHTSEDGEKALEELNYLPIKNKPCRIMWSQGDPSMRKKGAGNIFIKDLDVAIDNKALHDTFSAFGKILSCKVSTDEQGNSRGFGFVHFETQEAAESAIKHVNGMLLNDKKVYVGVYIPKKDRQSKVEEMKANFTNVFVKNLDESVEEDELVKMFEKFGTITSGVLSKTSEGTSKGFGFINFENHEDAAKAVDELNDTDLKGKNIFVGRAQTKFERHQELQRRYEAMKQEKIQKYQGVNLYVKNLADEVDEDVLKKEFDSFGTITSVRVMRDDGKSKGFGFVCFSTPEEAIAAVTEMNQKMVYNKPLYVALAQRKEVRRSQLGAQIQQRSQMRAQQQMGGMPGYMGAPMYFSQPPFGVPPQAMAGRGNGPYPGQVPGAMYPRPYGQRPSNAQGVPMYGVPAYGAAKGPESAAVAQSLASTDPSTHKQVLGEALYPKVQELEPELAGKVTGMLLEIDNGEILGLLDDKKLLQQKVKEALAIYDEYVKAEGDSTDKAESKS